MGKEKEIVSCKLNGEKYRKENCPYPDYDCITCPGKTVVKKIDKDKSIYRKKPYTPINKPCKDKASVEYKAMLEKGLKHNPIAHNPIAQYLVDLANKGANIARIARSLTEIPRKRKNKTGTYDMTMDLSNEAKSYFKEEKAINTFVRLLSEKLIPVAPYFSLGVSVNLNIDNILKELKSTIKWYLELRMYELCFEKLCKSLPIETNIETDGDKACMLETIRHIYPPDTLRDMLLKRVKPAKQSTHDLWNEAKLLIANELKEIGYSIRQSQKETAKLLNLFQPDIYTNINPDLIKCACKYHKKK